MYHKNQISHAHYHHTESIVISMVGNIHCFHQAFSQCLLLFRYMGTENEGLLVTTRGGGPGMVPSSSIPGRRLRVPTLILYALGALTVVYAVTLVVQPPIEQPRYGLHFYKDPNQMARCLDGTPPGKDPRRNTRRASGHGWKS